MTRSIHHSLRSGSAARAARRAGFRRHPFDGQVTIDGRRWCRDVLDEQPAGAKPARVRQLGQGRGGQQSVTDPDGRIECAGHHDRNLDLLSDVEQFAHPTQRRDLQHRDVGGPGADDVQRIVGLADALVGSDRHVDPPPHLGEFGHRLARLLHVLERAVGRQRIGGRDGILDAPAPVRVHPHRRH